MSIMQLTQTIHLVPTLQTFPGRQTKRHFQPMLPGMEPDDIEGEETLAIPRVTNRQIAEVLAKVADLIESQRGNPYRVQAYRNAARGILDLQEPAADILARGEELPVPGLGRRLRARISELVEQGMMTFFDGISMQTLPDEVRALMAVEHVGAYTAIRLYEELGISTPEQLWWAARQHRIRQLPGFGIRSEARLEEAAARLIPNGKHVSLHGAA